MMQAVIHTAPTKRLIKFGRDKNILKFLELIDPSVICKKNLYHNLFNIDFIVSL